MIAIFPEIAAAVQKKDVELTACLVRKYFGGESANAPRLDCHKMFHASGIAIEQAPIAPVAALIVKDEHGRVQIRAMVRRDVADPAELRFLLAHLMGHFVLHIQPQIARGEWQLSGVKETLSPIERYGSGRLDNRTPTGEVAKELMADAFAAALLMPLGMARRAAQKLGEMDKVATFFGVPATVVRRRLESVGVLADVPVDFFDAEARLKGPNPAVPSDSERKEISEPAGVAKLKRALARSTYAQQPVPAKAQPAEEPAVLGPEGPASDGAKTARLERLRAIARRIDPGV